METVTERKVFSRSFPVEECLDWNLDNATLRERLVDETFDAAFDRGLTEPDETPWIGEVEISYPIGGMLPSEKRQPEYMVTIWEGRV